MVDGVSNVTGWRYVAADDQVETYDAAGRLSSIATRDGSSQTLAYDARGRLSSVTDTYGRQLGFSYDAIDNLVGMTDASGGFYRYDYDVGNRFVSVTYPDDKVRRYVYNEPAYVAAGCSLKPLTGIIDENSNRYAAFFYDTACRAVSTLHYSAPGQPVEQYTVNYLNLGVSSIVSDPMGTQRSFAFSTVLDVIKGASVSQPCSTVGCTGTVSNAAAYDANGNLSRTADFNNKIVCYAYDNARNLETARVEGILPAETCPAVLANPPNRPDVRKTVTTWNATWRLPATITEPAAGGSKTTTFTYDGSGNLTQRRITAPKNDGTGGTTTRIWSWTYATLGRVLTATDPNGNVTTTGYYADNDADFGKRGNVATITNPLGYVTQIAAYDANARPLTTLDPNGLSTTLAYDARGRLTGRNVGGESTRYGYDGVGQLALVTLPDGSSLAYTYDGAHRLTQIRDGLGNKIVYTLDAMGNRIQEQAFDPSNTLARTRSRTFDSLNRLARDIGAASQTTGHAYDNNGNLVRATDPLGRVTTNTYDSLNRLKQVLDPANGSTRYDYDPSGNLITVTDPRNLATGYIYDGLGGVIRQVSPDTGTTTSTYDAAGNLQTRLDARGVTATYAYDALNRVTQIVYTKTGSSSETHTFEYDGGASGASDAKGRLTRLTDGVATTTWSYTAQGRVAGKTQAVGGRAMSVTYDYNAAGQLAELTTPSGKVLDYTYVNNRIASIALDGAPLVSGVVATPFGSIGAWQWGNGLYTFRRFDGDGRLTSWEFRNGGSVLRNNLTYNTASRVIGVSDPAQSALAQSYSYDALDRLTGTQSGNPVAHSQQFGYDAVGNRVNQTVDGNGTNYGYGATSNRLQALSGATTRSYTYDGAGNPSAIDARTYAYNLANRLTQVQSGATTALYGVNALGQRVSKTLGGATPAVFLYDEQGHLLSEYYSPGELDGTFQETVWLEDLPVATFAPMLQMGPPTGAGDPPPVTVDLHYVHADHLGTPRAVTRPSDNSVVWRWDNVDPFGANAATDGQGSFRFNLRFPGQYYDAETGTHYNYFRDYDPSVGRYAQSDPIGIWGGLNTYAYVTNNPLLRSRRSFMGIGADQAVVVQYRMEPINVARTMTSVTTDVRQTGKVRSSGRAVQQCNRRLHRVKESVYLSRDGATEERCRKEGKGASELVLQMHGPPNGESEATQPSARP